MAVALRGNLQDFGIAEVFQLIGQQRKTGMLKVSNDGAEVCLAFDHGAVVWAAPAAKSEDETLGKRLIRCGYVTAQSLASLHAEANSSGRPFRGLLVSSGVASEQDLDAVDSLLTHDTIFEVLRWEDGSFHFLSQGVVHERPQEKLLGAEQILMNGLRMVDEWQVFRGSVPSLDTIVGHAPEVDETRQRVRRQGGQHAEHFEKIDHLIDGRLTLQRVIDLARLGRFDATRVVAEMMDSGFIVALDTKAAKSAKRDPVKCGPSAGQRVVGFIAACAPLVILGDMVYAVFILGAARPERVEAFRIQRDTMADAKAMFEKRRIRHAIEAHRYLVGEWPAELEDLEVKGLLPINTMASRAGAAYYYAPSEDNVVLLAPER